MVEEGNATSCLWGGMTSCSNKSWNCVEKSSAERNLCVLVDDMLNRSQKCSFLGKSHIPPWLSQTQCFQAQCSQQIEKSDPCPLFSPKEWLLDIWASQYRKDMKKPKRVQPTLQGWQRTCGIWQGSQAETVGPFSIEKRRLREILEMCKNTCQDTYVPTRD